MAIVSPAFFDTTVLLSGLVEGLGQQSPHSQAILTAIARGRIKDPLTAWHCCLELYSVATRLPEEFRLTPEEVLQLLEEQVLPHFRIQQISSASWRAFLVEAVADRVAGGRVYDAHIAAIARSSGAKVVVTGNRKHFTGLLRHGIQLIDPEEYAAGLKRG